VSDGTHRRAGRHPERANPGCHPDDLHQPATAPIRRVALSRHSPRSPPTPRDRQPPRHGRPGIPTTRPSRAPKEISAVTGGVVLIRSARDTRPRHRRPTPNGE